jgi:DNA polymerase I-like protein with 3'-5' exonuclease and polymerase domains
MGIKSVDKDAPRGTGVAVLTKVNNAFTQALLEYREVGKLINTYIDKLPNCVNEKDGRIHCKFNQYGADTGRMSSSDPNLQNIPSHNKDIRKMFKATDGYVLMSSDFSQQEPKCLAALCRKQGDAQMYDTFMEGKDLYSEIASKAFNKPYEDCKEFRPDGTTNKEGKARRNQAKSILLGVLYGRGTESIAEQLGTTAREAQSIKDSVFRGFPAIKQFEEDSIQMSKDVGYVTTVCGRKRRLPSMMLPDYEIVWKDGVPPDDDPLSFDAEIDTSTEVPEKLQRQWLTKVRSTNFYNRRKVFEAAEEEGLLIIDHTKDKDTTKVVNARIQGSAADLTKLAMIGLHNNQRLKELGFRMLIPVHDEIIAECPEENIKECSELLASTMSYAAEQILEMPIKCDVEITRQWYGESVTYEE